MNTNIKNMKREELVNELEALGLSTEGKVADLQKRLFDATHEVDTTYAVNAIRPALIAAHKSGNKKAITRDQALEHDVTSERFQQWVLWVDDFYAQVRKYYAALVDKNTTAAEKANHRGRAFAAWRGLLKVGRESQFHKNMYIDETDMDFFVGFIQKFDSTEETGTFFATKGKNVFRKNVEAFIGCRMAANKLLDDDDLELIRSYKEAVKSVRTCDDRLNGTDDDKGNHHPGLLEQIPSLEKTIADKKKTMAELGVPEETATQILSAELVTLKELKAAKESTEKNLANAKEFVEQKTKRYNEIVATINLIEE